MENQKEISNESFEELVNFDPTLCLYLDLVKYNVKLGFLEKSVYDLVQKIIEENLRIHKVSSAIENLSEFHLVKTVHEFLRIYMFDEFCYEIKKSIDEVIFEENHNFNNLEIYVSNKYKTQLRHQK